MEIGGIIFDEADLADFNFNMLSSGARTFAVIEDVGQHQFDRLADSGFYRFSYDAGTLWNEIADCCSIAQEVFQRPIRRFFVISDNGRFGKYVDNDASPPTEISFYL